jgi:hypothetical protein
MYIYIINRLSAASKGRRLNAKDCQTQHERLDWAFGPVFNTLIKELMEELTWVFTSLFMNSTEIFPTE